MFYNPFNKQKWAGWRGLSLLDMRLVIQPIAFLLELAIYARHLEKNYKFSSDYVGNVNGNGNHSH